MKPRLAHRGLLERASEGTSELVDYEGQLSNHTPVDFEVLQDLIELAESGAAVCFPARLTLSEAKHSLFLQRARP